MNDYLFIFLLWLRPIVNDGKFYSNLFSQLLNAKFGIVLPITHPISLSRGVDEGGVKSGWKMQSEV